MPPWRVGGLKPALRGPSEKLMGEKEMSTNTLQVLLLGDVWFWGLELAPTGMVDGGDGRLSLGNLKYILWGGDKKLPLMSQPRNVNKFYNSSFFLKK